MNYQIQVQFSVEYFWFDRLEHGTSDSMRGWSSSMAHELTIELVAADFE